MKIIMTVAACGTAFLLVSSVQMAIAAQHLHARKPHCMRVVPKRVWGANASIAAPVVPTVSAPAYYSGGWSAPAGR